MQLFHKNGAFGLERVDDVAVVDNLVADVDRRAEFLQRLFDDLNGAVHARTKATRSGDKKPEGRLRDSGRSVVKGGHDGKKSFNYSRTFG